MEENYIPFALRLDDGRVVAVDDVPRGLACNCICPSCRNRVEACKGKQMQYFRHEKTYEDSVINCRNSYETSLHFAAKQVLEASDGMWLPEQVFDPGKNLPREVVVPARVFEIEKVDTEIPEGDIRPDIILYSGSEKVYCEIFVTHAVDDVKKQKLYEKGYPSVEIDLSDYYQRRRQPDLEELKERLTGKNEKKKWAFDARQLVDKREKYRRVRVLYGRWIEREEKFRITGCPKNPYENKKESNEDCNGCPFCAAVTETSGVVEITCTAHAYFSTKDPSINRAWTIEYINAIRQERAQKGEQKKEPSDKGERAPIMDLPNVSTQHTSKEDIRQYIRQEDLNRFETGSAKQLPIIYDVFNRQIVKCIICGELGLASDFWTYGGELDGVNYGVHDRRVKEECERLYTEQKKKEQKIRPKRETEQQTLKCPECGSEMKLRTSNYGKFWGCSKYPNCTGKRNYYQAGE